MKVRVGLVGLGDAWSQRHRHAMLALADRFEVRAVCDEVGHRAEQVAIEFGATAIEGFQATANREDVDAILMLAAQWYGALPLLAACDVGKAVYCAANLDLNVDQAKSIKQRVEKSGIAFMTEFAHRLLPATIRLKELIATKLGPANLIFCHHRRGEHGKLNGLPGKSGNSSEVDHELVELVDWCSYIVGRSPKWVTGVMHKSNKPVGEDDYQMLNLDFSDDGGHRTGPIAQVSCGNYIPVDWTEAISYRPRAQLQVSCENGIAFIDLPSTLIWFDESGRHQESLDTDRPVGEQLLLQFHRAITSLVRKTNDLEDACRAIFAVQEARRSSCEGVRVELN